MPANLLSSKRSHSIGVHTNSPTLEKLKEEILDFVLNLEPILARRYYDHLIQFKKDSQPPVLEWKIELLEELPIDRLRDIKVMCEKVKEEQQRTY